MKFVTKIIIVFLIAFLSLNTSLAEWENPNSILNNIKIENNINLLQKVKIDLSELEKELQNKNNSNILFEWNIPGENTINWSIFEKQFETFWEKELNLNIYKKIWRNRELISNEKINIFIYKTKILSIFQEEDVEKMNDFISKAKESWVFIDKTVLEKNEIEKFSFNENIISKLEENKYLIVWGWKDFMFDILSKINTENITKKINITWISGFNIGLLQKFLQNFTSNKSWINKAILLDESSKFEILKQPESIDKLEEDIIKNNYEYINLSTKSKINELLFISKFINNLSNSWFSINNIYLILIIPFLLIWVSIFKHLVGLTPTWVLIPVTITLLFLKLWVIPTFLLIVIFFITNVLLSKFIAKYSLHYTPKLSMLTIINIVVFIITINLFLVYDLVKININDIMFIIFFILIAEKLVNIIVSKEFGEYKSTLLNTLLFSLLALFIFKLAFVKTFILAYPEIILILIPLAFIIWRFTWLRVTEYFRFKEVIKSIEE